LFQPDEKPGHRIDTPFRDGTHAVVDGEILNLPVYAVFEDYADRVDVPPTPPPDGCENSPRPHAPHAPQQLMSRRKGCNFT